MGNELLTHADAMALTQQIQTTIRALYWLVIVQSLLIILQIALGLWGTARVFSVGSRVERHLDMAAAHGQMTDLNRERTQLLLAKLASTDEKMLVVFNRAVQVLAKVDAATLKAAEAAAATTDEVKQAVAEVPEKTATAVVSRLHGGDSGTNLGGGS